MDSIPENPTKIDDPIHQNWRIFLLLHLIQKTRENYHLNITKLEKLTFLSQLLMKKKELDGFDYEFIRWHYGPFTQCLYTDRELLNRGGFIKRLDTLELTPKAKELLDNTEELYKANKLIFDAINQIVSKYGGMSAVSLEKMIYEKLILVYEGHRIKLKNVPKGTCILMPLSEEKIKIRKNFPDNWAETLEIMYDKSRMESLEAATQSLQAHGSRPYASSS